MIGRFGARSAAKESSAEEGFGSRGVASSLDCGAEVCRCLCVYSSIRNYKIELRTRSTTKR